MTGPWPRLNRRRAFGRLPRLGGRGALRGLPRLSRRGALGPRVVLVLIGVGEGYRRDRQRGDRGRGSEETLHHGSPTLKLEEAVFASLRACVRPGALNSH